MTHDDILSAAGLTPAELTGGTLVVRSPIDGAEIAHIAETDVADIPAIIARSQAAFRQWRDLPAPRRGELVRLLGEELRAAKAELGGLVTLEVGKITSEGMGSNTSSLVSVSRKVSSMEETSGALPAALAVNNFC